jgi:hypothetical protein
MTPQPSFYTGSHNGRLCRACEKRYQARKSHGCVRTGCSGPCPSVWDAKLGTWMPGASR